MTAQPEPCPDRELLLHGLADGELDAAHALSMEEHLRNCSACAAALEDIMRHKTRLQQEDARFRAPADLRRRMSAAIAKEGGARISSAQTASLTRPRFLKMGKLSSLNRGAALASAMALAASLILFVSSLNPTAGLDEELVAAHVRSLLATHLTDVASSNTHTVKPWFLGKLDFAPPVIDLEKEDFPLIGGRLDYVGGRVVPALVYKRHGHIINLFLWPAGKREAATETRDGYHILAWTLGGFDYTAVSDLNVGELREFEQALKKALL